MMTGKEWALTFVVAFVIYIGAVGPLAALQKADYLPAPIPVIHDLYYPVRWARDHSKKVEKWLEHYKDFWSKIIK
jgi:hypothetical protein